MVKIRVSKSFLANILFAFISLGPFIYESHNLELVLLFVALLRILKIARFSYFSVFSFILFFSYLQDYFASIGGHEYSSGMLQLIGTNIPVYTTELYVCTMFCFLFEFYVFEFTNVLYNEKKIYSSSLIIPINLAYFFLFTSFILIVLSYPTIPTLNLKLLRNEGYLPSSLFVQISLLLLAVILDNIKKSFFMIIFLLMILFWIVMHGDRVIVLGYVIYVFLRYLNRREFDNLNLMSLFFNKKILSIILIFFLIGVIFIRTQFIRKGLEFNFSIGDILLALLKQGTAGDVVYNFNCSVDMWKNGQGINGYSYLHYIQSILPNIDVRLTPSVILVERYNTLGGGLFFSEPMMNGGVLLTFIYTIFFILLFVFVCRKQNMYNFLLVIPFSILIFRFAWYASLSALVKMFLYYIPLLFVLIRKFSNFTTTKSYRS